MADELKIKLVNICFSYIIHKLCCKGCLCLPQKCNTPRYLRHCFIPRSPFSYSETVNSSHCSRVVLMLGPQSRDHFIKDILIKDSMMVDSVFHPSQAGEISNFKDLIVKSNLSFKASFCYVFLSHQKRP